MITEWHRSLNIINNPDHITPITLPNIAHQKTSSPNITSVSLKQHNLEHQTLSKLRPLANNYHFSHKQHFHTSPTILHQLQESKQKTLKLLEKIPIHPHTANVTLNNIIHQADKHQISRGEMYANYCLNTPNKRSNSVTLHAPR